jgi:glycosyltransferase involved in cell wall biosynthesis
MSTDRALAEISLVVITLDEEENIAACIESVRGAGEVIVVDSFSTDATVEKARALGAIVHQREFVSNADQKNWAMQRATRPWVLILDADERLTPELREEIAERIGRPDADGYWIRRRTDFLGVPIRHCGWQRDRVLRLLRRGSGRYPERAVHERLELEGKAGTLKGRIEHHPYRDLDDYIERMGRYSLRGAVELHRRGVRWFPRILLRPGARFLRMYLLQLGFLDGAAGIVLCMLAAVGVMLKYAYLRELSRGDGELR